MTDATIKGLPPPPKIYSGSSLRICIVHARWNDLIIKSLVSGCITKLKEMGVREENIVVKDVPGSYELPFACSRLIAASQVQSEKVAPSLMSTTNLVNLLSADALSSTPSSPITDPTLSTSDKPTPSTAPFSAVIAIGCLIKGSTMHFEYICDAVSNGLMRVQLDTGVPVIFGVLTALTDDQALERAGLGRGANGKGHNHGEDWAVAAVELGAQCPEWAKGVL